MSIELTNGSAVSELLDAGTAYADPDPIAPDGAEIAYLYTIPEGHRVHTVDVEKLRAPHRSGPVRKAGTVYVHTVDALLAYHAKHAADTAELWVGKTGIVDVLNAHGGDTPAWEDHRAVLLLNESPEWQRWTTTSGKLLAQDEFAEFIEANSHTVVQPDMATMVEIAQTLEGTTKAEWKSAYRTADGQRAIRYEETANAKAGQAGELEIPAVLVLALRVYEGGTPRNVVARFRYRLTGEQLRLGVVIDRIPEIEEEERGRLVADIAEGIDRGIVLAGVPRRCD